MSDSQFIFTFAKLKQHFQTVIDNGYKVLTCADYVDFRKTKSSQPVLVNRVDIDFSPQKAKRLAAIFNELEIKATFFLRLHAKEYNPFAFEEYKIVKFIRDSGHEIGHHSEVIDLAAIWHENPEDILRRDLEMMEKMFAIKIYGSASHGGMTGLNNLDFWKERKPRDFGLLYEGYDKEQDFNLFQEALYVSDSNWTTWKCYDKGVLCQGDKRSLGEHAVNKTPLIYSLIHPETYFDSHFYE